MRTIEKIYTNKETKKKDKITWIRKTTKLEKQKRKKKTKNKNKKTPTPHNPRHRLVLEDISWVP